MDLSEWMAVVVGTAMMLVALVDLFLTTLHPDIDGPLARGVQRGLWRALVGGRRREQQRRLMALAGPLMMVVTFAMWVLLFMLGFALLAWPFLADHYLAEPELGQLGFIDALYFSGTTVTTLGYGDITPLAPPLQVLAVAASLSGFSMLTGIVAYLLEVLRSLHNRVRLALRVSEDTRSRHGGAEVLAEWLADDDLGDVRQRLEKWADLLRDAQDEMHRFPLVSVCYRSADPHQDPEPAVRVVAHTTIAGLLLSSDDGYRRLRSSLQGLDRAVTRFMVVMAGQYLGREVREGLVHPRPNDADRAAVEDACQRVHDLFGVRPRPQDDVAAQVADLACRARVFLDNFHRLTGWQAHNQTLEEEMPAATPR